MERNWWSSFWERKSYSSSYPYAVLVRVSRWHHVTTRVAPPTGYFFSSSLLTRVPASPVTQHSLACQSRISIDPPLQPTSFSRFSISTPFSQRSTSFPLSFLSPPFFVSLYFFVPLVHHVMSHEDEENDRKQFFIRN
jgi:hypothetical protein